MQKGQISVQTENIFPIIKQFLYSDQEIFLRELIANAVDATSKLKALANRGDVKGDIGNPIIEIVLDKEAKTLTIKDQGIGMTSAEVEKYLNQVAFSSAKEFLKKYENESSIIGHFGLGFYSAFMVAERVEVVTKTYKKTPKAARWTCDGTPEYTLDEDSRKDRGTDVILHISEDSVEYLENSRIQSLLDKYCKFLPVPIKFGTKTETVYEGEGDDKEAKETEVDNFINNTNPAWKRSPRSLKEADYKSFYQELYPYSQEPLFWIHLNIDFPFNLTGVLYFPRLNNSLEVQKNKIQLYSNQVYVTDDVKEIVPEFLTLLHGVIDSPDIPLNVSRSYLQSDQNVKKISGYITKKVADKLANLFKKDREDFQSKWKDLGVFIKYGMLSDEKFHDKAMKFAVLKNIDNEFSTLEEYREKTKATQTDKYDKQVFIYTNNPANHHSFIQGAKNKGYDVLEFDNVIDNHFMQHLEQKMDGVTFVRVDSDIPDNLVQKDEERESVLSEKEIEKVKALFEGQVKAQGASVQLKPLSSEDQPVLITRPEFMRRMKEMQAMQGMQFGNMPDSYNLVVNTNHPLVAEKLLKMRNQEKKEDFVDHLTNLALLNQGMLTGEALTNFISKSIEYLK
ncbi:MAG: molecular chaperone HtpG [Bacteroidota bacterium]